MKLKMCMVFVFLQARCVCLCVKKTLKNQQKKKQGFRDVKPLI